jgi:glycosyltransferase involved in cell wall biosynthesis
MRIAVAIPRYGAGVLGGAEAHGAAYARKLTEAGHYVEIVTTCSKSHYTWANEFEPGTFVEDGIVVRRFEVLEPSEHFPSLEWHIQKGYSIPYEAELLWVRSKGHSPGLVEYLADQDFDCVIFMPYLWGCTYYGVKAVGHKAVVHLLLHDEPYARLRTTREIVKHAAALLFNSVPEERLARRLFGDLPPSELGGMGFDPESVTKGGSGEGFRRSHKLGSTPLLLYAGRWEGGKGVPELIRYVGMARRRRPRYRLALIGGGPDGPRRRSMGIVPIGFVSEEEKHAAFRAADVFCQPSRNESLSIVLMEAWLHRLPVLVSGFCAVTKYHCAVSGGGLWYRSFPEFEAALEVLLEDRRRASSMGDSGRRYVLEVYGWDAVIERVCAALERWFG